MSYDELFDKLCDLVVASGSTPQTATLALAGAMHACLHKLPALEREAWFQQLEQLRTIHAETFGKLEHDEATWLN
jgi:hypothetical protein